jgi:hypothetical protein
MGEYGANECRYQEPRKPATHKVVYQSRNPDVIKLNFFKRHFQWKNYVKMDAIRTLLDGADVRRTIEATVRSAVAKSRATIEGSSAFHQVSGLNLAPHRRGDADEWSLESSLAPCFCCECCMGEYGANECRYQEPRKPATHKVVYQSRNPDVTKLNFFKRHFQWKKYVKMDAIRTLLDGADVWWLPAVHDLNYWHEFVKVSLEVIQS